MVYVVKASIVIFRKIKTILILISFKRYFSHSENSMLDLSLPQLSGGIVIAGPGPKITMSPCTVVLNLKWNSVFRF